MIQAFLTKNFSGVLILIITLVWIIYKLLDRFVFKKNNNPGNPGIDLKIANQKIECTENFNKEMKCINGSIGKVHKRIDEILLLLTKD